MRAVARTPAWRQDRGRLERRIPDDIWEDEPGLWIASFQAATDADEEVLVFHIRLSSPDDTAEVFDGIGISRRGDKFDTVRLAV
jgi:hypothetical protein